MTSRYNFEYLLFGLLILLLATPTDEQFFGQVADHIVSLSFACMLVVGVWTLTYSKKWFTFGIVLAIAGFVLQVAAVFLDIRALKIAFFVVFIAFCTLSAVIAFIEVTLAGLPNVNRLMGAICIYLLLGVIWGTIYILLELLSPGSFHGLDAESQTRHSSQLFYFSFVTITTLGYGDITPELPLVRTLTYLEAIVGQMYIAVLIAGLVGSHIANRTSGAGAESPGAE
jgi:hypothetical protein